MDGLLVSTEGFIPLSIGDARLDELTLPRSEIRHGVLNQFAILPCVELFLGHRNLLCVYFPTEGTDHGYFHPFNIANISGKVDNKIQLEQSFLAKKSKEYWEDFRKMKKFFSQEIQGILGRFP